MANKINPDDLAMLRDLYLSLEPGSGVNKAAPNTLAWMARADWTVEKYEAVAALASRLIRQRHAGNAQGWVYPVAARDAGGTFRFGRLRHRRGQRRGAGVVLHPYREEEHPMSNNPPPVRPAFREALYLIEQLRAFTDAQKLRDPARAAEIEAEGARAIRALWVVEGSGM